MQLNKSLNPFINATTVPFIEYITDKKFVEGEYKMFGYRVEATRFSRMYTTKSNREFVFRELSRGARDLLFAVQYLTNPEYPYVIITKDKMDELYDSPVSLRGLNDSIRELIKKCVLDYKDRKTGQYWYNPNYFCSGNRIEMYPECLYKVDTRPAGNSRELHQ